MSLIPLQQGIVYGPILSRRLGRSLGVNLFPADRKICPFDCGYCHFGPTADHTATARSTTQSALPAVADVLAAVEEQLASPVEFEFVTLSGNGEPTLYPDFAELVTGLRALIRRLRPEVKLCLLSNSARVADESLYPAFALIDVPVFKLDAADPATFAAINHPCPGVAIEDIIHGLERLARQQPIVIQTVLADGPTRNYEGAAFAAWIAALQRIRPAEIQLYTTDRPVASSAIRKLAPERLGEIAARVQQLTGITTRAY
jgi:wyosine [tRNA(Phe)-imidazoG37] synthetase (radical SAM superfamily)